ncbi:MAG TPA: DUF3105 domain-containing protein [Acidimicrobiales bacterium]|nr:DUF3105 domain-containing protein [Acidimicrobiales bacterium]
MKRKASSNEHRWGDPRVLVAIAGVAVVAVIVGVIVASQEPETSRPTVQSNEIVGLQKFTVPPYTHVPGPVQYPQTPPVGGSHGSIWQDCGFYSVPIVTEYGVHSMEHGAVWITYRPDLSKDQVETLKKLATSKKYVLVSPWPGLPASIVASAWGKQVQIESATDPRVNEFVTQFSQSKDAPEAGSACIGGSTATAS